MIVFPGFIAGGSDTVPFTPDPVQPVALKVASQPGASGAGGCHSAVELWAGTC